MKCPAGAALPSGTRVAAKRGRWYALAMALNIVMLGDIVGQPGRRVVSQQLPALRRRLGADLAIANAENSAAGSGLTPELADELFSYGLDGLTLGDHAFRRGQIIPMLNKTDRIARPANLPRQAPGRRWLQIDAPDGRPVVVVTVLGRLFMTSLAGDDPFACVEQVLREVPGDSRVIVEVHAEATSEKVAMGHHFDGRVAAVVGTHTHIPTADAKRLPGGTAYLTDLGMTGPYDSVLGRRKDRVLQFMTTAKPAKFDVAEGDVRLCGMHLKLDDAGKAVSIDRVEVAADPTAPPFTE